MPLQVIIDLVLEDDLAEALMDFCEAVDRDPAEVTAEIFETVIRHRLFLATMDHGPETMAELNAAIDDVFGIERGAG